MNEQPIREIVDVYLVKCDKGVIALCNEQESKTFIKKAEEKNIKTTVKKITTNLGRANQLGDNIFRVTYPCKSKDDLINFRNTVIKEWITRCDSIKNSNKSVVWQKVASKYNISITDPEQFSQSIVDKIEYTC